LNRQFHLTLWSVSVAALLILYGLFLLLALASPHAGVSADAASIADAGRSSRFFYDSGFREPLQPLLARICARGHAPDVFAVRTACAVASWFALLALIGLSARVHSRAVGLVAGAVWVLNPYIAAYSAQGDRLTLIALLLFCYAHLLHNGSPTRRNVILLGLAGAACALARAETLLVVIAASLLRIASHHSNPAEGRRVATALLLSLALFAPYPLTEWARTGSPFHASSIHARFWANHEFAGTPLGRHATREEVHTDPYRGGPLSPRDYILGMHSFPEVVTRYIAGYARLATSYLPRYALPAPFLAIFTLIGVAASFRKTLREDFAFVLLCHVPFAFIYPLDPIAPGSGVEARFALHTAPFIAVWTAMGITEAVRRISRKAGARHLAETDRPSSAHSSNSCP
jgi:hypothetical protein